MQFILKVKQLALLATLTSPGSWEEYWGKIQETNSPEAWLKLNGEVFYLKYRALVSHLTYVDGILAAESICLRYERQSWGLVVLCVLVLNNGQGVQVKDHFEDQMDNYF